MAGARAGRARRGPSLLTWLLLAEAAAALAAAVLVIVLAPRPSVPAGEGPFFAVPTLPEAALSKAAQPQPPGEPPQDMAETPLDAAEIAAAQARITAALAIGRQHLDQAARQQAAEPAPPTLPRLDEPPLPLDLPEPPLAQPAQPAIAEPPALLAAWPAPAPAPQDAPAPAQATPRIVIHHPAGADPARRRAQALAANLPGAEIRAVRASPTAPGVRFFFAADRDAAQALARAVRATAGAPVAVADFSHFRPLPRPGTLEVWLPQP